MIPITVQVPAFSVAGVAVRTCNRDEAQPERARIGALWDQFFTESWARQLPGPGPTGASTASTVPMSPISMAPST